MASLDLFSERSDLYAAARPQYPSALFDQIAAAAPGSASVWDCATGNGQAALALSQYFDRVLATDHSAAQIAHAQPQARVTYSVQSAEQTTFANASIDAVCVAQALHWFATEAFYAEVYRVLKPSGIFAAWGYSWMEITPSINATIQREILDLLASHWAPNNALLWDGYRNVLFPFDELPSQPCAITVRWNLDQLLDYMRTWSATRALIAQSGEHFLLDARNALAPEWGNPAAPRTVCMPLVLRLGRRRSQLTF